MCVLCKALNVLMLNTKITFKKSLSSKLPRRSENCRGGHEKNRNGR